ncbi:MAG TPA: hypothetical protein DIU39_08590 [Flavobacteriales bacterium]|nr:hypothetical protein [Flavobacteriales bacterium]|tara:strand:+ start:114916 stop:115494 length:579 start_codon:yes stop_codon:yes gene_type:complete
MKKYIYLFSVLVFSALLTLSCGNKNNTDKDNNTEETTQLPEKIKRFVPFDLSPYGYNLEIYIPDSLQGIPNARLTDWGAIILTVGNDYGVEITYGDGDLSLLKEDLNLSDVFKSTILTEETEGIIYKQEIPDANIVKYHFMVVKNFGADVYEIKDFMEKDYTEAAIEKMFEAAKTLKKIEPKSEENNDSTHV